MTMSALQFVNQRTISANGSGQPVAVIQPSASASNGAYFDHVVVIMMENEGISDICNSNPPPCSGSNSPYMSSLANNYGISQQYLPLISTSEPNYYGILGASIFGCPQNCYPPAGGINAPNLVDRFEAVGLSWKGYMENQNVAVGCDGTTHEPYEHEHNGFVSFQNIYTDITRCNNLALANPSSCGSVTDCVLINDLNSASAPNFMWLTPNDCDNMHANSICSTNNGYNGCTSGGSSTCIKDGDNYLKSLVPNILNSLAFQNQRSALFIVFDEGTGYCPLNGSSESCLYAVWAGPVAKTSFSSSRLYNHYSLTKTIEVNWNLATLTSNDAGATPMTEFFNPTSPSPDFSVYASPTSLVVNAGSTSTSTVTLTSLNNFAGTVALSSTGSPAGLSLSLSPASVSLSSGGTGTSTLSVGSSNPGSYTVTITGTSGSLSHQTAVTVNIVDFSLTASPSSVTISPGSSATSTISLKSLGGFVGTVTISSSSSPSGPTLSLSSASVTLSSGGTGTTTLTISTQSSTPVGDYTVTVAGSSGSLSHSTSVLVSVKNTPDFSIAANPTSITLQPGASSSSTITVSSLNGFSGTVTLTDSISPATSNPPVISLSSSSLTVSSGGSAGSTLSITTTSSTTPGSYAIVVTGTSGSLSHTVSVSLTISQAADFSLTSNSPTVNILAGSSGTSTMTAASLGGFSGTVSLSVSAGTGLTATVNPTSLALNSGGTASSTLTVSSGTLGNYTVTVTGTSGSLAHSVSVLVIVSDFSITVNPSSLSLPRGTSGTSLVTLTSLNGFTGTVTLSTVVSPTSGPRTSLSSSTVTLTPGGQSNSTLNVRAQHKTPIGAYTITVTATSGSVSHSVTITADITA